MSLSALSLGSGQLRTVVMYDLCHLIRSPATPADSLCFSHGVYIPVHPHHYFQNKAVDVDLTNIAYFERPPLSDKNDTSPAHAKILNCDWLK